MAYTNIDDPSAYFQTTLYTGDGSTSLTITNDGNSNLKPDLAWFKRRDSGASHNLYDSSRGATTMLYSNLTDAEYTNAQGLQTFNTDGFTVGNYGTVNAGSGTFVAWQWKANGGTTASNTSGTINSTVQVNQDAGFSIVTYTGTGVYNKTVGHGLGIAPAVVILKNRTTDEASYDDWWVYHKDLSNPVNRALRLNETGGEQASTVFWSVLPSSTIFGIGGSVNLPRYTNGASQNYIAYCFAEKQGFSKFGKYVGNGDADGPFVYTGFKPAFVMIKNASAVESWVVYDTARNTFNLTNLKLSPDTADSENNTDAVGGLAYNNIDILSNGFKCRSNNAATNGSGNTIIYMAFAENPFTTSTGIPTTAR